MRRVLIYCDHTSDIWRNRIGLRANLPGILESGTRAYALKQADIWNRLALKFAGIWFRHLSVYRLAIEWPEQYISAGISAAALHSGKKSTFLARLRARDSFKAPMVSQSPDLSESEPMPSALLDLL